VREMKEGAPGETDGGRVGGEKFKAEGHSTIVSG
jgi:hypothetical protein